MTEISYILYFQLFWNNIGLKNKDFDLIILLNGSQFLSLIDLRNKTIKISLKHSLIKSNTVSLNSELVVAHNHQAIITNNACFCCPFPNCLSKV